MRHLHGGSVWVRDRGCGSSHPVLHIWVPHCRTFKRLNRHWVKANPIQSPPVVFPTVSSEGTWLWQHLSPGCNVYRASEACSMKWLHQISQASLGSPTRSHWDVLTLSQTNWKPGLFGELAFGNRPLVRLCFYLCTGVLCSIFINVNMENCDIDVILMLSLLGFYAPQKCNFTCTNIKRVWSLFFFLFCTWQLWGSLSFLCLHFL